MWVGIDFLNIIIKMKAMSIAKELRLFSSKRLQLTNRMKTVLIASENILSIEDS